MLSGLLIECFICVGKKIDVRVLMTFFFLSSKSGWVRKGGDRGACGLISVAL